MQKQSLQADNPTIPGHQVKLAECDLVMKGGVTSGIVYPPAIKELIDIYRLRSIGGTSVGAMAAAAIAAAEFYRQTHNGSTAGFVCLDTDVKEWLKTDNNLLNLFPATQRTRPLLQFALKLLPTIKSLLSSKSKAAKPSFGKPLMDLMPRITGAIIGFIVFAILTLAVLALFSVSVYSLPPFLILIVVAAIGAWLGWQVGNLIGAIIYLPQNFYGICTGYTPKPEDRQAATPTAAPKRLSSPLPPPIDKSPPTSQSVLNFNPGTRTDVTDWLDYMINCISGKEQMEPLTIKDLSQYKIELKMVTTNLSQTLPYIIPDGLRNFLFNETEMMQFFPNHIVQHMIDYPPTIGNAPDQQQLPIPPDQLPEGYHFLPDPENLPVVFCTRLSLSFPILMSAVPLYTLSTAAYQNYKQQGKQIEETDLLRNWLSDGGICSNFPIHFFDAWLPDRPTLGINLLSEQPVATCVMQYSSEDQPMVAPVDTAIQRDQMPLASPVIQEDQAALTDPVTSDNKLQEVFLLQADSQLDPEWRLVDNLFSFGSAIFGSAQNYRDMKQAELPSYRERIAQIRLDSNEGGLNLNMDATLIEDASRRGRLAGKLLHDQFDFNAHSWVRFLVLMAQLEKNVGEIENELMQIKGWLKNGKLPDSYPYNASKKDPQWPLDAERRIDELLCFVQKWKNQPDFFRQDEPLPKPVLRVRPEV